MKHSTIYLIIVAFIVILGFVIFTQKKEVTPAPPVPIVNSVDEQTAVEDYLRANIKNIATDKAVLGGTWYVVSLELNTDVNTGRVVYEDGHIQSAGTFSYNFDNTNSAVVIENFKVVSNPPSPSPSPISATGVVSGRVTLSPICPVERIPPDPACAPKGYETTITAKIGGKIVKSTTSNANGDYKFTLPPGAYEIQAKGGATLPYCNPESVTIKTNTTQTLDLSCDTGIR